MAPVAPGRPPGLATALRRDDPNAVARAHLRAVAREAPGRARAHPRPAGTGDLRVGRGRRRPLIVLGPGARGGDAVDGLVDQVLAHAPCPVLVARPPGCARDERPSGPLVAAARP